MGASSDGGYTLRSCREELAHRRVMSAQSRATGDGSNIRVAQPLVVIETPVRKR